MVNKEDPTVISLLEAKQNLRRLNNMYDEVLNTNGVVIRQWVREADRLLVKFNSNEYLSGVNEDIKKSEIDSLRQSIIEIKEKYPQYFG